jgi:hypothetical protein
MLRFGGLFPPSPSIGGYVDFTWSAGEFPAHCGVISHMFSHEYLSQPVDAQFYIAGTGGHYYQGERTYYGKLVEDRQALTPIYERFRNPNVPLRDLASLFSSGINSETGRFIKPVQGENPCYHCQPVGRVDAGPAASNYRQPLAGYADVAPVVLPTSIALSSADPFVWSAVSSYNAGPLGSLAHALPRIKQEVNDGEWNFAGNYSGRYHNFDYTVNEDGSVVVFFHYIVGYDDFWGTMRYINTWAVKLELTGSFKVPTVHEGGVIECAEWATLNCRLQCANEHGYWHTPVAGGSYPWNRSVDTFQDVWPFIYDADSISTAPRLSILDHDMVVRLTTPAYRDVVPEILGFSPAENRYNDQGSGTFLAFDRLSDNLIRESMPLLHLAAVNAFDNHVDGLSSNYLETLSEYASLFGVLDIGEFTKTLIKHYNRKIGSLLSSLNILASATLLYQFGIAPTLSDAEDIAEKANGLRSRVLAGEIFKGATTYGSYKLLLPDDFPVLPGSLLTARCKLRMNINDDVFLQRVVQGRALGILPTPSGLWDLIPGSFAIDWLFPVGDSLAIVENQALLLALDIQYCTLSITIERDLDVSALTDAGAVIEDVDGVLPGYRKYVRFVSRQLPTFGPTSLPILESPVPKWSTAGSLAIVLST